MTTDPRARWAEWLPGAADAPPEEAAAAFLRALPGDGFHPPAERVAAANALAGTSVPTGRDPDVERLLRDELDAFAAGFWELAPAERLTTWADLSRRGADAARLRELEPGLDVHVPALTDPAAEALAALVRTLFVMPPRARAIRRNTWLLEQTAGVEKWRAALAVVRQEAPALVALEPRLDALDSGSHLASAALAEGASAAPIRRTRMSSEVDAAGFSERVRTGRPSSTGGDKNGAGTGGGWSGPGIGWAIFGLLAIVRLLAQLGRSDSPPSSAPPVPPRPSYSAPADRRSSEESAAAIRKVLDDIKLRVTTDRAFTPTEVAEFERYEREKKAGKSPAPLPDYDSWLKAGRPPGTTDPKRPAAVVVSYSFDEEAIQKCQEYHDRKVGSEPLLYSFWLAADKPNTPGRYPLKGALKPPR